MTDTDTSLTTVIRGVDRLSIVVVLSAITVFAGISVTHLPEWVTPPHYPPMSPAYASPFSSPGLTFIPSEGWAALAVIVAAVGLRTAIAHRWPGLAEREKITDESQYDQPNDTREGNS